MLTMEGGVIKEKRKKKKKKEERDSSVHLSKKRICREMWQIEQEKQNIEEERRRLNEEKAKLELIKQARIQEERRRLKADDIQEHKIHLNITRTEPDENGEFLIFKLVKFCKDGDCFIFGV